MEFFYGAATGLAMSLMLGTVFFLLIQNSIDNGYRGGILIALGVITSDTLMITLSAFGASFLPTVPRLSTYASLAGGVLLLTLGFVSLFKESPRLVYPATRLGNLVYCFSSGFVLNGINPANFFIWVAVTANLRANLHYSPTQTLLFFLGCLAAIFFTEVGVSVSADRLKRYFTPRILMGINKVSGSAFVVLGLRLLWTGWRS